MEFISDYLDDPTQNFVNILSKALTPLGYSGHEDSKIDASTRSSGACSIQSSAPRWCASSTGMC